MVNSQDVHHFEKDKVRSGFRMLDLLYTASNGYKYGYFPLRRFYKEFQVENDEAGEQRIREIFEYLRRAGLVESKALGTASITNEGIKEFESAILRPSEPTNHFPSTISEMILSEESRRSRKREIEAIKSKRRAFLAKAHELSKGSPTQHLSASKIMDILGYDQKTLERIYFYFQDDGVIKPFAIGGKFTLTLKGIELAERDLTR